MLRGIANLDASYQCRLCDVKDPSLSVLLSSCWRHGVYGTGCALGQTLVRVEGARGGLSARDESVFFLLCQISVILKVQPRGAGTSCKHIYW